MLIKSGKASYFVVFVALLFLLVGAATITQPFVQQHDVCTADVDCYTYDYYPTYTYTDYSYVDAPAK